MGKDSKSLTTKTAENLKWEGKDYKRFDTEGLFLHIKKNGKYWRMKYTFNKKEKLLSFGSLDNVSLSAARIMKRKARELLSQGIDPSIHKQIAKEATIEVYSNTFELIAREWWETEHRKKVVEDHAKKNIRRFEQYIFPFIGNIPLTEVKPLAVLECLRRIESKGYNETAHRVKTLCSQVYTYAIRTGRAQFDIAAPLTGALLYVKKGNHAAITDPDKFSNLLKLMDGYVGTPVVKAALQLSPLVFTRPGELRKAKWEHINFETNTWEFTPSKIRKKDQHRKDQIKHIVPLSKQAVSILKEIKCLTSKSAYVFPSFKSIYEPMSDNAVRGALRSLGLSNDDMTPHGFRASATTMLLERLKYKKEFTEKQLAHVTKDPNDDAYDRTKYLEERTEMMQHWADYLDELRNK